SFPEDFADHNLSKMYWYALEPLAETDPERMLARAAYASKPTLLSFAARRVASAGAPGPLAHVVRALGRGDDTERQIPALRGGRGTQEALRGRRQVGMPKEWPEIFTRLSAGKDAEVRRLAQALAVSFGDASAFDALQRVVSDRTAAVAARQEALAALLNSGDKN